eukprot:PhM_4_TR13290/c0_g1_i1/m.92112
MSRESSPLLRQHGLEGLLEKYAISLVDAFRSREMIMNKKGCDFLHEKFPLTDTVYGLLSQLYVEVFNEWEEKFVNSNNNNNYDEPWNGLLTTSLHTLESDRQFLTEVLKQRDLDCAMLENMNKKLRQSAQEASLKRQDERRHFVRQVCLLEEQLNMLQLSRRNSQHASHPSRGSSTLHHHHPSSQQHHHHLVADITHVPLLLPPELMADLESAAQEIREKKDAASPEALSSRIKAEMEKEVLKLNLKCEQLQAQLAAVRRDEREAQTHLSEKLERSNESLRLSEENVAKLSADLHEARRMITQKDVEITSLHNEINDAAIRTKEREERLARTLSLAQQQSMASSAKRQVNFVDVDLLDARLASTITSDASLSLTPRDNTGDFAPLTTNASTSGFAPVQPKTSNNALQSRSSVRRRSNTVTRRVSSAGAGIGGVGVGTSTPSQANLVAASATPTAGAGAAAAKGRRRSRASTIRGPTRSSIGGGSDKRDSVHSSEAHIVPMPPTTINNNQ